MRAYVGSLTHETNRFSPFPTTLADYRPWVVGYGDLIREARQAGCDVIEGRCAHATPSGVTRKQDYETLRDQLLEDIRSAGPLELVLLFLHGAQVAQGYDDCEGDIVSAVRRAIGPAVTLGVMLDLHASITGTLLHAASLVTVIKEYPHTDFPETAAQLVALALRQARRVVQPVCAFVPVPVFSLWHTPQQPAKALVDEARALEQSGDVLHVSLVHGFPWSDVSAAGAAVLVYTDDDIPAATRLAERFARRLWQIRTADLAHYHAVDAAIDLAVARGRSGRPAVIADAADNPGAGCGGDATWILRELLRRDLDQAALALLWDPAALRAVVAAGEGASVALELGGHSGELAGPALQVDARVECINSVARIDALPGYEPLAVGTLAALRIGGVQVVLGDYREQVFGPLVFSEVQIDPRQQRLLVVKSAQHFYPAFAPFAASILYCDSPGSRTIDFSSLPFQRRRHPIWPLDACTQADIPAAQIFHTAQ